MYRTGAKWLASTEKGQLIWAVQSASNISWLTVQISASREELGLKEYII
jgi:hypothetical protein